MPIADSSPPSLDFASLNFPSDQITLATIRRVHGLRFNREHGGGGFSDLEDDPQFTIDTMLFLEQLLARAAFERARGTPGDYLTEVGLMERTECIEELTSHYRTYGVAQGPQHTEQLVRDIESQAAEQAGRWR